MTRLGKYLVAFKPGVDLYNESRGMRLVRISRSTRNSASSVPRRNTRYLAKAEFHGTINNFWVCCTRANKYTWCLIHVLLSYWFECLDFKSSSECLFSHSSEKGVKKSQRSSLPRINWVFEESFLVSFLRNQESGSGLCKNVNRPQKEQRALTQLTQQPEMYFSHHLILYLKKQMSKVNPNTRYLLANYLLLTQIQCINPNMEQNQIIHRGY